ncbi:MAG: exo-alpha-sialidase [Actinobacteria bacterium]|nr:exo-alpha-sialidase [Actinomycetota bacterium]
MRIRASRGGARRLTGSARGLLLVLAAAAGVLAVLAAALVGLLPGETVEETGLPASQDEGPVHVHGLGIDPRDGALFIATHTGLFRAGARESTARRVTDRHQDTMGFTVVGPNRFLGSGHPDLREARERHLPPLLGLVESRDAGRSWTPVSLLGQADFHVLRSTARRIYGYDATHGVLHVSRDRGRTWTKYRSPAPLIDLAAHPSQSGRIVASTPRGLFESSDDGRSWSARGGGAGLLAWRTAARLYLVTADGRVSTSSDAGRRWRQLGAIGGEPVALTASGRSGLYAALHDGTIMRSGDGGLTWRTRFTAS